MVELVCSTCYKTYYFGYFCVGGRWIPGIADVNIPIPVVDDLLENLKYDSNLVPSDQTIQPSFVSSELENIHPEFLNETSLSEQVTRETNQFTISHTGQASASEGVRQQIAISSEQSQIEEFHISETNNQVLPSVKDLNNVDTNIPMTLSFPNNEKSLNTNRRSRMECQLRVYEEDNLGTPLILKSYNKQNEFATASGFIQCLPSNEVPMPNAIQDHLTRIEIQNDQLKLINRFEDRNRYMNTGVRNDVHCTANRELNMRNEHQSEMSVDRIRLAEANRQILKYEHNTNLMMSQEESTIIGTSRSGKFASVVDCFAHDSNKETATYSSQLNEQKCFDCLKGFKSKDDMNGHICVKKFICNICQKAYTHRNNLSRHMNIHKGLKPNNCDICGKYFRQKNNLNKHRLLHMNEKLFKCYVCESSFKLYRSLKCHKSIHIGQKPYSCDVCEKLFTRKDSLKVHISGIHRNEIRYVFEVCGNQFKQISHLQAHVRYIHANKKP